MPRPRSRRDVSGDRGANAAGHDASFLSSRVAVLILPSAFLGALASAGSFIAQTGGASDAARMSLLVASITLAEAFGSALAARLPRAGLPTQLVCASLGAVLFAAALARPAAFPPLALVLAFLLGVAAPLRAAAIQRLASDAVRARAASLASACDMAFMTVALPLSGFWPRR